MSIARRLYSGNPGFDLRRTWGKALIISVVVVAICVASLAIRGLELGIDFEGGGVWEVPSADLSVEGTRDALRPIDHHDARIQELTSAAGARTIRVQAGVDAVDDSDEIVGALAEAAGTSPDQVSINTVGPTWGDEITGAAERALIYFFIAIAVYLSIRLEWRMAAGALVAVVHDIAVTVGVYSLFQFTVTPATVIAFLTILGYSLYDTVVVFDKVKESTHLVGTSTKMTYTDMTNYATNEVFMRSVNTTITSLLPIVSILLVGSLLLGATTLQEFGIALAIGLAVGAYSSLFVAIPALTWLKEREPQFAEISRKLGGNRSTPVEATEVAGMASAGRKAARDDAKASRQSRTSSAPDRSGPAAPTPRVTPALTHPPRPRKKGKRR
ncbi:MAG: protein translocase subunit SecF [Acidimicrobiales bacterium]